ncbi:MAG: hypothetical protein HYW16_06720 [Candidatus Rokubacteria bacterium]|nr:hypothetical protein [Candidatus Rokubacteria bacterium]
MNASQGLPRFPQRELAAWRVVLATITLLLVVGPALDLGWNEPTLEQGALCQFHANPGAAVGPAPLVVWHSADPLSPSDPVVHFALLSPSIFIPPRA